MFEIITKWKYKHVSLVLVNKTAQNILINNSLWEDDLTMSHSQMSPIHALLLTDKTEER